jgi:two-component system, NarL family, response regulator
MTTIRVLIAEDNELVRRGIVSLLRAAPNIELVGEAPDGAVALKLYHALKPDVLITDMKMPGVDGIALTAAVLRDDRNARILVLTQYEGDETIRKALRAGALGYVTKETAGELIVAAIEKVAEGHRYVPTDVGARLAERAAMPELSLRERQVLELIAEGLSNKDIGLRLEISDRTVGVYVSSLLGKLEVKSRTEAVSAALRRGIIESP